MYRFLTYLLVFLCCSQLLQAQDDGVVALDLPVRNSLRYNRYAINPTFSFVREQNRYVNLTNKRQWAQFEDAPQTFLFGYNGRFRENIGAGIGLFQQNYGVLTTFGGILNFAYNAAISRESNLTFGLNLGFYSSGIDKGRVNVNFLDPSLDDIQRNSIITINPGINYGTGFFDFGLSVNNLVSYNLTTSEMIENNPEQSFQAHVLYTGYMNSGGFFDQSKFSTLIRSEFKTDTTVLSGIAMLTVPRGIWAQLGYNTLYGFSAGIGLNITKEIGLEYNYEQAVGDISALGNSHEITIAYKIKNSERFTYGDDDEELALLSKSKRSKRVLASSVPASKKNLERIKREPRAEPEPVEAVSETKEPEIPEKTEEEIIEEQRLKAIEIAAKKRMEEERLQAEAEEKARQEALAKQQVAEQAERAKLAEQARLKAEAEAKAKKAEEARLKAEQEEKARLAEEARLKAEQEEQARLAEEVRMKAEQEEQARLAEEVRMKAEQEEQIRLAEEAKQKEEAELARLNIESDEIIPMMDLDGVMVPVPGDKKTREMNGITVLTTNSKIEQESLLDQLRASIFAKQQDLDDLKKENDLSEQGIVSAPRAFKSISAENALLQKVQADLDKVINTRDKNINALEALYTERLQTVKDRRDPINQYYAEKLRELKAEQTEAVQTRTQLNTNLERINVATEFERKRRIKRAAYDNEQVRYEKDRAALKAIKDITPVSDTPLTADNFDSGEVLSNVQIVKGVTNTDNGYYMVVAVHTDVNKRDDFIRKALAAGESNIDFFFDVNTNKYYIYYDKFEQLDAANRAMESKGNKPYNVNMSMVKVEN